MSTVINKENMPNMTATEIEKWYTDNPHSHHTYIANQPRYELYENGNVGTIYDEYVKNSDGICEYTWSVSINNPITNLLESESEEE